jgi:hypothetical protein
MPIDQEYAQRRYRVFQAHDFETSGDKKTSGENSELCRTQMSVRAHFSRRKAQSQPGGPPPTAERPRWRQRRFFLTCLANLRSRITLMAGYRRAEAADNDVVAR